MAVQDDRVVRGRMDAVFGNAVDGWVVVDWKTGRKPTGAEAKAAPSGWQARVHLLAIGRPVEGQSRQIVTVTAQRPGQFVPRAPSSSTWHRTGTRHQPSGHRDDVPLKALRPVDGEHLHPLGVDDDLTGVEAVLFVLGRFEKGEKRRQGRFAGLVGEVGGYAGTRQSQCDFA